MLVHLTKMTSQGGVRSEEPPSGGDVVLEGDRDQARGRYAAQVDIVVICTSVYVKFTTTTSTTRVAIYAPNRIVSQFAARGHDIYFEVRTCWCAILHAFGGLVVFKAPLQQSLCWYCIQEVYRCTTVLRGPILFDFPATKRKCHIQMVETCSQRSERNTALFVTGVSLLQIGVDAWSC